MPLTVFSLDDYANDPHAKTHKLDIGHSPGDAETAFELASADVAAAGGGIIIIPAQTTGDFVLGPYAAPEATVVDIRTGRRHVRVPTPGTRVTALDASRGSDVVRRTHQKPALAPYGHDSAAVVYQRNVHGGSSLFGELLDVEGTGLAVKASPDPDHPSRWYPASIEGLFVGQSFYVMVGDKSDGNTYVVRGLGWDADVRRPYFLADAPHDVPMAPLLLISNKSDLEALEVIVEDHCPNQAATQAIMRRAYSQGDTFGAAIHIEFQGDIISTQGDEAGVGCVVEISQDLRVFRATADSFTSTTDASGAGEGLLTYTGGANAEHLGSARPIINLNRRKWIASRTGAGLVRIHIGCTYPDVYGPDDTLMGSLGITQHGVVQGIGTSWRPEDVVGRYFAVDEWGEYLSPDGVYYLPTKIDQPLYRWFRITRMIEDASRPDGERQLLFVRNIMWGTAEGAPQLVDDYNYDTFGRVQTEDGKPTHTSTTHAPHRDVQYIIAPGAIVSDVSGGVRESNALVLEGEGSVLKLQSNGDFGRAGLPFEHGDPVEQALCSAAWNPVGFRVRHHAEFPSGQTDSSFLAMNYSSAPVRAGLTIAGPGSLAEAAAIVHHGGRKYRIPYQDAIQILTPTKRGIVFGAEMDYPDHLVDKVDSSGVPVINPDTGRPVQQEYPSTSAFLDRDPQLPVFRDIRADSALAILFDQSSPSQPGVGNRKAIAWSTVNGSELATLGYDPVDQVFLMRGGRAVRVRHASLDEVRGISAGSLSANNLRGSASLAGMETVTRVKFTIAEADVNYFVTASVSGIDQVADSAVAAGAVRAYVRNKATDGFDLCLEGPPGTSDGKTGHVTVDWMLMR